MIKFLLDYCYLKFPTFQNINNYVVCAPLRYVNSVYLENKDTCMCDFSETM